MVAKVIVEVVYIGAVVALMNSNAQRVIAGLHR
jgi:hypothetical protein